MRGHSLTKVISEDEPVREYAIFGIFGGHVNITDGDYVYMRGPATAENQPLCEYTLMPTHMRSRFSPAELSRVETLAPPFPFTKDCPTLKIPSRYGLPGNEKSTSALPTQLFDLKDDPDQATPIHNSEVEALLSAALVQELKRCDAPKEQYSRLGLQD